MTILSSFTALVIDKNPSQFEKWEKWAKSMGFKTCFTSHPEETTYHYAKIQPDIAVLGSSLKQDSRLKCLQRLKIFDPYIPVYMTGDTFFGDSYLYYPFEPVYHIGIEQDIGVEILKNAEKLLQENRQVNPGQDYPIIGKSEAIIKIRQRILSLAAKDITVLVTGESGTGKELIARAIHRYSKRNSRHLVKIQCGSLPDALLESEILGFQKGAFTGAERDKPGRLEIANGGTLFIDEVGDLSFCLQSKFLNILEDKEFSRLGDTLDKRVEARIIAATNVDLRKKMTEGSFRKDLFYRLNVANIIAPALRYRIEDIPLLTDYFLNKYAYELKRDIPPIPDKMMDCFMVYQWPGNVRELENVLRRIIALGNSEFAYDELERKNVSEKESKEHASPHESANAALSEDHIRDVFRHKNFSLKATTKALVYEVEKEEILSALRKTNWNRKKAAKLLKVSYKTILNRIDDFNLKP